jgi:hypothetical protein
MKILVRPVHHESERQKLLDILQSNLPNLDHARRFPWLYLGNPDGPAWSWFVFQGTPNQVVGMASVFPRSMWVGDKVKMCGQVGDFAISASHRSLGPALVLQRATFEPVDHGKLTFCYDCPPHEAGMSTFRRLGIQPNCRVDRYALPLRVDAQIQKRFGSGLIFPAGLGNLLLRLYRRPVLRRKSKGFEVSEHTGPFGEEFSQLDVAVQKPNVIRGQRSAAHLNWRYREDPMQQYEVLTIRRKGELIAFAVFCASSEVITIVDLFGVELQEAAVTLLAAIVERFERSHQTIEAFLSECNELVGYFLNMQFRLRSEAARVVAYAKPKSEIWGLLQTSPNWSFSQAEIRA